jgi:radical SAM protein with 4Fe4S-binding SPASM domain
MVAVSANGNLYPCLQMSGYYDKHNLALGNVKEDGLQKYLKEGAYLNDVCTTVSELAEYNEKCATCQWFKQCCGGCRALGFALTGEQYGSDLSKCLFFNGGYLEKVRGIECRNKLK